MTGAPILATGYVSSTVLMRSIGTSFSAAIIGAVLSRLSTTLGGHPIPAESGFHTGPFIGCGVAVAAAAIAAFIPVEGDKAIGRSSTSVKAVAA